VVGRRVERDRDQPGELRADAGRRAAGAEQPVHVRAGSIQIHPAGGVEDQRGGDPAGRGQRDRVGDHHQEPIGRRDGVERCEPVEGASHRLSFAVMPAPLVCRRLGLVGRPGRPPQENRRGPAWKNRETLL
jgi:hypothetical protein